MLNSPLMRTVRRRAAVAEAVSVVVSAVVEEAVSVLDSEVVEEADSVLDSEVVDEAASEDDEVSLEVVLVSLVVGARVVAPEAPLGKTPTKAVGDPVASLLASLAAEAVADSKAEEATSGLEALLRRTVSITWSTPDQEMRSVLTNDALTSEVPLEEEMMKGVVALRNPPPPPPPPPPEGAGPALEEVPETDSEAEPEPPGTGTPPPPPPPLG